MGGIVGADADSVNFACVDQLFVAGVALCVGNTTLNAESLCLAGNQVSACNDFYVGHFCVLTHVGAGNPAGTDDTDLQFLGGVDDLLSKIALESIQIVFAYVSGTNSHGKNLL
jgi:hypothetical protein